MRVILENIRSVHNVGSMFRTADGAGVEKVYLSGFTPDVFNRLGEERNQFTKVSLGAEKFIEWERAEDTVALIKKLQKEGFKVIAVEQTKAALWHTDFKPESLNKTVFVFGHEVDGVSKDVLEACDGAIMIKMRGQKKSLNVSVAFGIIVYHYA
ncbi:MAG: TrmH family RNA methyltransferase [bacterium]|nr:TrmH family RNA methyltransferase [bacterium]